MKTLLRTAILTLLLGFTLGGKGQDIKRDMVRFDQAFIPLWVYVNHGDMSQAKSALFLTEFQWQRLRGRHENEVAEEEWTETFRRVNEWLGDAYFAIDANRPLLALNQLDHARYELQHLRGQYRIDYYLDHIYDLQDEVYNLIEIANDRALCMLAWPEIEILATAALQHWRNHKDHPLDANLYQLDETDLKQLSYLQQRMETALEDFLMAVETAEREAIAVESSMLEAVYLELLSVFGRFEKNQAFFAQQ